MLYFVSNLTQRYTFSGERNKTDADDEKNRRFYILKPIYFT